VRIGHLGVDYVVLFCYRKYRTLRRIWTRFSVTKFFLSCTVTRKYRTLRENLD
jgi:hypothetical protein